MYFFNYNDLFRSKKKNKMTLQQFIRHQNEWKKDFYSKHRFLDIDFETYILMNTDITKKQFRELMDKWESISPK